jgi:hypothetical protein
MDHNSFSDGLRDGMMGIPNFHPGNVNYTMGHITGSPSGNSSSSSESSSPKISSFIIMFSAACITCAAAFFGMHMTSYQKVPEYIQNVHISITGLHILGWAFFIFFIMLSVGILAEAFCYIFNKNIKKK